jgi:death-on-curing protein
MAAAYAFHLCQNHPFVERNKLTGLASGLVFFELNGVSIDDPEGLLYQAMIDVASGSLAKLALGRILRALPHLP